MSIKTRNDLFAERLKFYNAKYESDKDAMAMYYDKLVNELQKRIEQDETNTYSIWKDEPYYDVIKEL